MATRITTEQAAEIKSAFDEMRDKQDLLKLLNHVNWILGGSFMTLLELNVDELTDKLNWIPAANPISNNTITQKQLDFFATSFAQKLKKRKRYTRFYITKKNGKQREINAPVPKLLEIQQALNCIFQALYTVQEPAFGFAPGKSIMDNAKGHAGKNFVLNVALRRLRMLAWLRMNP